METNKPLSIHHSNMIQQLHDNSISVVDMTNPYILPPIYSHIVVPVKSETSLFLQPTLNNTQQLDNTIDTTTTVSSLTNTPKSKTVVYSMEQTPIKKRKAKSSSSNNSKASSSVDSDTTTTNSTKTTSTTKHKTKKRKTTSDSYKIVTNNSSALCSPTTNDSSTSSSTITVQKVVKENQSSPKKNRNTNEGLQPFDSRALAEFSKHLSELNEKEMERSINFLLPRYKIDFLKALISSCKSKSYNYLNNYRKSHNKSQMLTEILTEKSETLNLIKLFTGNEENESNNTIVHNETDRNDNVNNKVESTIDSNEVNNNTNDTNEMNQSIIENQQVSNNNELDCQSYYDITLDLIQSNYLPYSFNVDNLHNQTDNNTNNNSNTHNTNNNSNTHNTHNNSNTLNHTTNTHTNNNTSTNVVDDSFSFSDFLDCNDENDKSKQDLINDLTRQLNEKDQQIIELNRMFQEQECYNQNLLNIIQTFKNNLYELEMNYHFI